MLDVSNTVGAASLLILFQSANVPLAHGDERHVVLTNNTHELITEIYVSDDRTDNWQEDHLGSEFLLLAIPYPLRSTIATAIVGLT